MSSISLSEKDFVKKYGQELLNKLAKAAADWYEFSDNKDKALEFLYKNKEALKNVLEIDFKIGPLYRGIAVEEDSKMSSWTVGKTFEYKSIANAESWTTKLSTAESFATNKKWHGGKELIPKMGLVIKIDNVDNDKVLLAPGSKIAPWFIKKIDKSLDKKTIEDVHKESEYLIVGESFDVTVQAMSLNKEEELEKGWKGALAGIALSMAPGAINSAIKTHEAPIQGPEYKPEELKPQYGPEYRPELMKPKEHKMVFDPKTLHPDLIPIAHLESSFGKNMKHAAHSKGEYHTAIGALGFKPSTAHEEYLRSKHMQKLFPGHTDQAQFMDEIRENPSFYNSLAALHFNNIKKRLGGSLDRAVFAWRWGQGASERADDKTIQNDGYVKNYKKISAGLNTTPKEEVKKSEIQDLEKMAIAAIKPGVSDGDLHDYSHLLSPEHVKNGYQLKVSTKPWARTSGGKQLQAQLFHNNSQIGNVDTEVGYDEDPEALFIYNSQIGEGHRGKGLGTAMYEATMAHAFHKMGAKRMVGEKHSTSAAHIHKKVSDKHGMDYQFKENWGPGRFSETKKDWENRFKGPYDGRYESYNYTIKSELDKSEDVYNYDHVLSPEQLNEGYSIRTVDHGPGIGQEHVLFHNGKTIGELTTQFDGSVEFARLARDHKGKGLGQVLAKVAESHLKKSDCEDELGEDLEKKVLDPNLGYKFTHEHHDLGDGDMLTHIKAHHPNGSLAGEAMFEHHPDGLKLVDITVHPEHQRIGLGSAIASHVQKITNKNITTSTGTTLAGEAFLNANAKNPQFSPPKVPTMKDIMGMVPTMKYDKFDKSAKEWTERQLNKSQSFIHYSHLPILKELDPSFQGTGLVKGQERERPNRIPRTYVYLGNKEPESSITTLALYKYEGKLPNNAKIYDINKDVLGLLQPSLEKTENGKFYIPPDLDEVERQLIQLGYSGYTNYSRQYPQATALFTKVPLKRI